MAEKFLISVDTQDMAGKVVIRSVILETEVLPIDSPEFLDQKFRLVDPDHPIILELMELCRPRNRAVRS